MILEEAIWITVSSINRESYRNKVPCQVHGLENLVWWAASQQTQYTIVPVVLAVAVIASFNFYCEYWLHLLTVHFEEGEQWMGAGIEVGSRRVRVWLQTELSVLVRTIVWHFCVQYKCHIWGFFQLPRISLKKNDRWQFLKRKKNVECWFVFEEH